jgi:hypothetical protein
LSSIQVNSIQDEWPDDQQLITFIRSHINENAVDKLHDYIRINITVESVDGEQLSSDKTWGYNCTKVMDENPDYEDSYLCPKNALPNAEDVDGTLWYAEDNFDQNDKMVSIDIEFVSVKVPGNIHFY